MVTTTTPNRGFTYPGHGEAVNSWDTPLNTDLDQLDLSLGGTYNIHLGAYGATTYNSTNCTAASTVTTLTLPSTLASNFHLKVDGTISANLTVNYPSAMGGQFVVTNNSSGAYTLTIASAGGGPGTYEIAQGGSNVIGSDGTEIFDPDSNETASALPVYLGDPNTNVAGTAGVVNGSITDAIWDPNDHQMWICTTTGTALTAVWSKLTYPGFNSPLNLGLSVTHTGGNLLSVALKNASGLDPSTASPVTVPFQTVSAGATTGASTILLITSALSMTSNALGATLGVGTANQAFRVWIALFNNAGTPVLAVRNCTYSTSTASTSTVQAFALSEYGIDSTTGISGSATSAGVWYTPNGTSLVNCAFRVIGYCEFNSGLAVPGTYAVDPTNVVIFGPGIKKPGDIVQSIHYQYGTNGTGVNHYAPSTAIPTTAGQNLITSLAITPKSPANLLRVIMQANITTNGGTAGVMSLHRDAGANAIAVTGSYLDVGVIDPVYLEYQTVANTAAATTFSMYAATAGGSLFWNEASASVNPYFGGLGNTFIHIEEIMA